MLRRALPTLALLLALVALAGCPHAPAAAVHPEEAPLDLAKLADELDPGTVPPLIAGMPAWLSAVYAQNATSAPAQNPDQLVADLEARLGTMLSHGAMAPADVLALLGAVYDLSRFEGTLDHCDLACLATAEKIYVALDIPMLADPQGFMSKLLDYAVDLLGQQGLDRGQVTSIVDFLRNVFRQAPARQRWVAVRILRSAPTSPEATQVLRDLAVRAARDEDTARLLRFRRAIVGRATPTSFDDASALAEACLVDGRLDCADDWHQRASELATPAQAEAAAGQTQRLGQAHQFARLGDASLEDRLARAHLLIAIGLPHRAVEAFARLAAAFPDDARPLVGQARASFDDRLRTSEVAALLAKAKHLAHHDQLYFELAVGMLFARFLDDVLPQATKNPDGLPAVLASFLPDLQTNIDGLAAFLPARAAVLRLLVDEAKQMLASSSLDEAAKKKLYADLARDALGRAVKLRAKYPDEPDTHRVTLVVARFGGMKPGDYDAVLTPVPAGLAGRDEIALTQASLLYAMVVGWNDRTQLAAAHRLIDALPELAATAKRKAANLRADAIALDGSLGGRDEAWPHAEAAYRALLTDAPSDERARLENNLAVTLWHQGKLDEARTSWQAAVDHGDTVQVAKLNLLATEPVDAQTVASLETLGSEGARVGTRYQALRWRIARGKLTGKDREAAIAGARAELDSTSFGISVSGDAGVVLDESFNVGVGYSTVNRLVTTFELGCTAWLVIPAPAP